MSSESSMSMINVIVKYINDVRVKYVDDVRAIYSDDEMCGRLCCFITNENVTK